MQIIACYNIKGGVGKTAAAINLAYSAAHQGYRTLLWDLDPQGAASFYLHTRAHLKGGGEAVLRKKHRLDELAVPTEHENLMLIPADISCRNLDLLLFQKKGSRTRLSKRLSPLDDDYDYLFIDCPPGISLLSENVFEAADVLLVPTIPTPLSLHTLGQISEFCEATTIQNLRILPFFSMVDRRKTLHRDTLATPPAHLPQPLAASIPYAAEVENMGVRQAPIQAFAPASVAARAYNKLWAALKAELDDRRDQPD